MSTIPEIQRITTAYLELEDRIRLTGETREGNVLGLWLTQRLFIRLLPYLFRWLEEHTPSVSTATPENSSKASSLMQGFAQQEAQQVLNRQPVRPVPLSEKTRFLLVKTVDLSRRQGKVVLTFNLIDDSKTRLLFTSSQLRQWLTIVKRNWEKADWPPTPWPDWMDSPSLAPDQSIEAFH